MRYPGCPYDEYLNFSIESPKLAVRPQAELIWVFYEGNDLDDPGGETWELSSFRGKVMLEQRSCDIVRFAIGRLSIRLWKD